MRGITAAMTAMLGAATPLPAFQADRGSTQPLAGLTRCRSIADPAERLACFDKAAASLDADVAARRVTVLDREGVRRARRSLFGLDAPSDGILGRAEAREEVTEVDGVISRVQALPQQRYEITLADGARWRTTEPSRWEPTTGSKINIRKAALGSYRIRIEGMPTLRGQRTG